MKKNISLPAVGGISMTGSIAFSTPSKIRVTWARSWRTVQRALGLKLLKLKLSKKKPIIPCEECGAWGAHYKDCPVGQKITAKLQREADEIREQKLSSNEADELFGDLRHGMRRRNDKGGDRKKEKSI